MVTVRGYGGIAPPAQMSVEEADAAIAKFSNQMMEDYEYLVAVAEEADGSYEEFYAVACSVRNRVRCSVHNHENGYQINSGDVILYFKRPENRWYDQ